MRQQFDSAMARTRASVTLLESIGDTVSSDYDVALNNYAASLNQAGRSREASDVLARIATLLLRKGGESSSSILIIVANRAGVALQLGEFETARTMLEREASRLRALGVTTQLPPMIAQKLIMTYERLGRMDSVSRLASAFIRDSTLGLPPPVMLDAHVALGNAELQSGHIPEAQREAAQVARLVALHLQEVTTSHPEFRQTARLWRIFHDAMENISFMR